MRPNDKNHRDFSKCFVLCYLVVYWCARRSNVYVIRWERQNSIWAIELWPFVVSLITWCSLKKNMFAEAERRKFRRMRSPTLCMFNIRLRQQYLFRWIWIETKTLQYIRENSFSIIRREKKIVDGRRCRWARDLRNLLLCICVYNCR